MRKSHRIIYTETNTKDNTIPQEGLIKTNHNLQRKCQEDNRLKWDLQFNQIEEWWQLVSKELEQEAKWANWSTQLNSQSMRRINITTTMDKIDNMFNSLLVQPEIISNKTNTMKEEEPTKTMISSEFQETSHLQR